MRHRGVIDPTVDCLAWALSITVASLLRYEQELHKAWSIGLLVVVLLAVVCQIVVGFATTLYRVRWRVGSFEQIVALAGTNALVAIVVVAVSVAFERHLVPLSASAGGAALAVIISAGLRCGWRLVRERKLQPSEQARRAVIFGAGEGGAQIISALTSSITSPYAPVALIDDDPAKRKLQIKQLRVEGTRADLAAVAARARADTVIVAIPSASAELIRDVSDQAAQEGLSVRVLPTVPQIFAGTATAEDIRPVTPADFLGRHVIDTKIESIAGYLRGRRVLVTGAGGSIGSELCRQIQAFEPDQLIVLDRDESGIHQVQLSLEGRALLSSRSLVVCDIRDAEAVDAVFAEHRPEVVFHAAALKHLPLLEMWPAEATKTNVVGTQNVLDAALQHGVGRFVNISTDKAADPCSILGLTKRIGERLTSAAADQASGNYMSVRFGNVLGSRGSVFTTFLNQIQAGGPITVTHPDVTRFFMTVEEAVQLVVQAGAIGRSGEVLVFDMGEPVRIADVARRLAREAEEEIEIEYTGLRSGEKLHEVLFGPDEEDRRPVHPLISHVWVPRLSPEVVAERLGPGIPPADMRSILEGLCAADLAQARIAY